jgi:hypothetical protein
VGKDAASLATGGRGKARGLAASWGFVWAWPRLEDWLGERSMENS